MSGRTFARTKNQDSSHLEALLQAPLPQPPSSSRLVSPARPAYPTGSGALRLFTDGLTDSISGENAENRLRDALADDSGKTMDILKSLADPHFNEDDVTILLVKRAILHVIRRI